MSYDTTFIGNILTSETSGIALTPARITISGLGYFDFNEKFALISPPQWMPNEINFDYEAINGDKLRSVKNYKARFNVDIELIGRDNLRTIQELLTLMNNPYISFNSSGFTRGLKFYLRLDGDSTAPTLECVLVSKAELTPKYVNNRLIGYTDISFTLETVEVFSNMQLPKASVKITSITTGTRSIHSRVYAGAY